MDEYRDSDNLAEIYMAELAEKDVCKDGFLLSENELSTVFSFISTPKDYEIIWVRLAGSPAIPPLGFQSIGFEPSYFIGDHFSASCDCMLFPRWHGTDKEGTLFLGYFNRLNTHGLFESTDDASAFLDYYLSFDWTERGDFEIVEIFIDVN